MKNLIKILPIVAVLSLTSCKKEQKADQFAQEFLIPTNEYEQFVAEKSFDKSSIIRFAHDIGIHPSIVLGRLQKEGFVEYSQYQELKISYNIIINGNLM